MSSQPTGSDLVPSPYGDDVTVKVFLERVDRSPKTAIRLWRHAIRLARVVDGVDPRTLPTAVERLEHGDATDAIDATLQRMWQGLEKKARRDQQDNESICESYRGVLACCGNYLASNGMSDRVRERDRRFFLRILGDEETLHRAVRLATDCRTS